MPEAPELLLKTSSVGDLVNPFAPPVGPATIVIFGATGDLTRRKLLPSLHNLAASNLLDPPMVRRVGAQDRDNQR